MFTLAELALCIVAAWRLVQLRRCVRGTTLVDAWRWACGLVLVAAVIAVVGLIAERAGQSFAAGDCLLAAMALTPLMAILGARRPTNRVWTPFVMLPLLVVLNWPVWWHVLSRGWWGDVILETPAVIAYCLVIVMACGNYMGTRLMAASFAWGAAILTIVVTHSTLWHSESSPGWLRIVAAAIGVLGLFRVEAVWSGLLPVSDRLDRLWFEFLDRFGVVWGRRIQERLNALASQQKWSGRLEIDGWHWTGELSPEQRAAVEHAFRWLLRRFVDPDWLNQRLGTADTVSTTLPVDS